MAQGDILYRAASAWKRLAAGTSGKFLKTQGASADPIWDTPAAGSGTVTNTGTLTSGKAVIGNGGVDVTVSSATGVAHLASGTLTGSNVVESEITLANNTTNDVSTSKHGFTPILPNDASKYLDGSGAYSVPVGTVAGGLLGLTGYAAGSDSVLHTQSTNTMTAMDATNAIVTFTAPANGKVLVRVSVLGDNNTTGDHYFGLLEGVTTVATAYVHQGVTPAAANRTVANFSLTGVSAGSHTYKAAHRATAGSVTVYTGPNYGQIIIEVWSAP